MRKTISTAIFTLLIIGEALACDMSAFEQSDFADKCQRLINYCDKAYIALLASHPDTDKKLSELSKDWVDFYLSHGKKEVQPPNMSFVDPTLWESSLNDLGMLVSGFLHKTITAKDYQILLLRLNLMKNEEKLTNLHNSFKAADLCELDLSKIEDLRAWLECRFIAPASFIFRYVEGLSELRRELDLEVADHIESFERIMKLTDKEPLEIRQLILTNLDRNIRKDLDKWKKLCLYK